MSRKRKLDTLVVIDLEATCWADRGEHPPSEIIEIGATTLNLQTLEVGEKWSQMVKPVNGEISPFCTQLTTITQEMVDKDGIPLKDALCNLEDKFQLRKRPWASWGDYDRKQLQRETTAKQINFQFLTHLNLKSILAVEYGWEREYGMDEMLGMFHLSLEGTHHRGGDDALNIARIYREHIARIRGLLRMVPMLTPIPPV